MERWAQFNSELTGYMSSLDSWAFYKSEQTEQLSIL